MKVTISSHKPTGTDTGWDGYLDPGEKLLWTGRPEYGRRFFQVTGLEKTWQWGLLIGTAMLWLSWPLIDTSGDIRTEDIVAVFGVLTVAAILFGTYLATTRSYILSNLHYAVTDRRAIVRREGPNIFLAKRAYFVSCAHSHRFAYPVIPARPHPSVRVGSLLSEDALQPAGHGLTHPGWSPLRDNLAIPVLFEQIPDADQVHALLLAASDAAAWRET